MIVKDIICPICGRPDISSPLNNETNYISLDEDNFININFNQNMNNASSISYDPKYQHNQSEKNNINSNSIYSIDNFKFSIINAKNGKGTNTNKKAKGEMHNYYKKVIVKKKLGRKTKRSTDSNVGDGEATNFNNKEKVHDRFSDDNMRKKCKNLILKFLLEFINDKIKIKYNYNIGHGKSEKALKILNQNYKKKATVNSDREFMDKTLCDIFSQDISDRFRKYSSDHNKNVIESLINEDDEIKGNYFSKLFNLTFRDCLMNLSGEKYFEELEGFKNLTDIKDYLMKKNDLEYADYFIYYIKNFEKMINKRDKNLKIKEDKILNI